VTKTTKPLCLHALALLALVFPASLFAQAETDEPPIAGRPENFSGIVGAYRLAVDVDRTEVVVEGPLTLTVRTIGQGPAQYQPERKNLRLFSKEMLDDFYVEDLPKRDRHLPEANTWEFVYRLRPKHSGVKQVPGLKLVYYLPTRMKYQTTFASPISLEVRPRPAVKLPEELRAPGMPERIYEVATGDSVLRISGKRVFSGPWPLVLLVAAPPALCAIGLTLWRRRHPDVVRLREQLRNRAATQSLQALQGHQGNDPAQVAGLVVNYLQRRLALVPHEPTPDEVVRHLRRKEVSRGLAERFAGFFQACDAARFSPAAMPEMKRFAAEATELIHSLEAEPCLSRAS
jgi:hypothetical protein